LAMLPKSPQLTIKSVHTINRAASSNSNTDDEDQPLKPRAGRKGVNLNK
jgi:hypothetical protein